MRILTLDGIVPADTILPLWNDIFPALIDPAKIRAYDGFDEYAAGDLVGKSMPHSTVGALTWTPVTGHADVIATPGSDGGYVAATSASDRRAILETGHANLEVMVRLRPNGGAGSFGPIARWADANNYLRALLIVSTGTMVIQARIAGVTSTLATKAFVAVAGETYDLRFVLNGTALSFFVDDEELTATSSDFTTATSAGFFLTGSTVNRVLDFYLGW